jgi:hypothetical protein
MYHVHASRRPSSIKVPIALEELGVDYALHAVNDNVSTVASGYHASHARVFALHSPRTRTYVSSIRQLLTTGRSQRRNAFSSPGNRLSVQRCTVEWSTEIPRSAIICPKWRRLGGYATYQRTQLRTHVQTHARIS